MANLITGNLDSATARALIQDILKKLDVPPNESSIVAETLLESSLSGYDSHGLMRISPYVKEIRKKTIVPGTKIKCIRETLSSAYLDANKGLGPVAAKEAVQIANKKATQTGVGCVSIINANDIGRLGSYLLKPAEAGLITIIMVNDAGGGPSVAPWGGIDPFLSTNPLAAGIPWKKGTPIIIDISTSVTSSGKLQMLANRGECVPEGVLIDGQGNPSLDLCTFFSDPKKSALLPLGGTIAGHKGFALSLLVDILAGALSGSECSTGTENKMLRNGVFILSVDPEKFVSLEDFQESVVRFLENLKTTTRIPGLEEILIPGERAFRERQKRIKNGIPIDKTTWSDIKKILIQVDLWNKYPLF